MKALPNAKTSDAKKVAIIAALFATSVAIAASGFFFCIYGYIHSITFQVLNTNVPGFVFGICVFYLGLRYTMSVFKLKRELFQPDAHFSWDNFRKHKAAKSR